MNLFDNKFSGSACPLTLVREKQYGVLHEIYDGAPCQWSADKGATHTLLLPEKFAASGRTRPVRLKKTVAYVGTDETETGEIKWEKWQIKTEMRREKR